MHPRNLVRIGRLPCPSLFRLSQLGPLSCLLCLPGLIIVSLWQLASQKLPTLRLHHHLHNTHLQKKRRRSHCHRHQYHYLRGFELRNMIQNFHLHGILLPQEEDLLSPSLLFRLQSQPMHQLVLYLSEPPFASQRHKRLSFSSFSCTSLQAS